MQVSIIYNLPDDLELYKQHLEDKLANRSLTTKDALIELREAITNYMLVQSSENLFELNRVLDKYADIT